MDGNQGVARIILAGKHVSELDSRDFLLYGVEPRINFLSERLLSQFFGNLQLFFQFSTLFFELLKPFGPGLVLIDLCQNLLGFLLVFPEVFFSGDLFKLPYLFQLFFNVKDTPVTVLCGGGFRAGALFRIQTLFLSRFCVYRQGFATGNFNPKKSFFSHNANTTFPYFASVYNRYTLFAMSHTFYQLKPSISNRKFDGRRRVIIEGVSPEIDDGRYPAKRVAGEKARVRADIFTDGADTVRAELCHRAGSSGAWKRVPMKPLVNDSWEGMFIAGVPGVWEYTVEAWIDHFQTWRKGLIKKIDAGQDVSLELRMGAAIVEQAAGRASKKDAVRLRELASVMKAGDASVAESAAQCEELHDLMQRYPDKEFAVRYDRVLKLRVDQKKAGFSTWYEFFPRSWAQEPGRHGTFKECQRLLPLVSRMGFDVVYLPPIHPIGSTKRKGRNNALVAGPDDPGSCWAIGSKEGGHKAVHPELGTVKDFEAFIREAERHGISVAMDIAFQCSPDHPYVKEHPQWFKWRPDGTVQFAENPPKKYEDILPIDFETKDWESLWIELKNVMLFWMKKGVRIFRVDNPHTKAFLFWDWAISEIKKEYPDAVFLAEAFTRPKVMARLAKGGFDQSYTYFTWRNTKKDLQEYLTELTTTEVKEYMRPNFWPNTPDILHEELQAGHRSTFIVRLVLAATLSSNYGMYGPAYELCEHVPVRKGKEEYLDSEKYEIKQWDMDRPGNIRAEITDVNRIRRENSALQQTNNIEFVRIDAGEGREHEMLMAYVKRSSDDSNIILTVVNLDPRNIHAGWLRFPLEHFELPHTHRFRVEDLMNGRTYEWDSEWNFVELNPEQMPAHIFRVHLHP